MDSYASQISRAGRTSESDQALAQDRDVVRARFVQQAESTLGREAFEAKVQDWIERNGGTYWDQVDKMIQVSKLWLQHISER